MYAIRVDASRHMLNVELSGRLTTAEGLRAVSQAFALAEASSLRAVVCDARTLRRGPGGLLLIAAALSFRLQPGMRIALLGVAGQQALVERLIRYTGSPTGIQFVESASEAETYIEPVLRGSAPVLSSTELRHAEELLVARPLPNKAAEARIQRSNASGIPAA